MKTICFATSVALAVGGAVSLGVRAAEQTAVEQGHAVFSKWCAPCHAKGPGNPGTTALEALYQGTKPAALEDRTDLTPETVKHFVRNGVSVMPFFRKTEISDAELEALAAYFGRNLSQ
jgi:mono/diheme cytochrome c family protein